MGVFANARERFPVIKFLVNAQKTVWYPILFGILCLFGGINNYTVYIPIMWLLIAMHLFSVLFTDDNKVFLVPLCMMYFAIGKDYASDAFFTSNGNMLSFMHKDALKNIIAMGIIGVGALLIRLVADGSIAAVFKKRRRFTWGIIALSIAFLLNGIFSPTYNIANFGFGALMAMGFAVIYILVSGIIDRSDNVVTYACYIMVSLAYSTLMQILVVVYRLFINGKLLLEVSSGVFVINRGQMTLGWGVSTVVAGIFVLGIPAAMFLAKNRRAPVFSFFSCILFITGTLVVNARGAMAASVIIFVICSILCCVNGKNRKCLRICTAVLILLVAAALIYTCCNMSLEEIGDFLRFDFSNDSGRQELWINGISDFKKSPIFGAGFADGAYSDAERQNNFYSNMYHCIFVQLPAALGIVGCIAFLVHIVELFGVTFARFSANRFIVLCVPFMILGMSILDNFFFYLQFQILYCVFLAVAEKTLPYNITPCTKKGAT